MPACLHIQAQQLKLFLMIEPIKSSIWFSRIVYMSGLVLKIAGVLSLIEMLAFYVVMKFVNPFLTASGKIVIFCLVISLFISLGITLVAGILRASASVFSESQMRLNELIFTFFVAGTVITILQWLQGAGARDAKQAFVIINIICVFLTVGCGSAWGWSVASRLQINDTFPRLKMLFYGWLMTAGSACLAISLVEILLCISGTTGTPSIFIFTAPGSFLVIPGIRTELSCSRMLAEKVEKKTLKDRISTIASEN